MEYDWNSAPNWANFAATDRDGQKWWYENEPTSSALVSRFNSEQGRAAIISALVPNWRETMQKRPTVNANRL